MTAFRFRCRRDAYQQGRLIICLNRFGDIDEAVALVERAIGSPLSGQQQPRNIELTARQQT